MSLPPQPGSWQPPQQAQGAHGGHPHGQSYGPPPPGYQEPWYPPPGPPRRGGGAKWVLLGVAALVIVAVSVAVTVVVLHSNSGGNSKGSTTSTAAPGIASANDNGPVTVITEDPSCAPWTPIINTLAASQQNGWDKRDPSIPASAWSPEQRAQSEAVGAAIRHAADQTVALAKLTPHRVMRELYEQTIAYWYAYVDRIPNYAANDNHLVLVTTGATAAIGAICNAITYGSAAARGPLVAAPASPTQTAPPAADLSKPQRFLSASNPICTDWEAEVSEFNAATAEWQKTDSSVPASQWSPEQKALNDAVGPVMSSFADKREQLGRRSSNPTLEDFAVLSAQYVRAYVLAIPTYVVADQYLNQTASYSSGVIRQACQAVGN
jgi:hypothetical protein